jgi:hypothetical protein
MRATRQNILEELTPCDARKTLNERKKREWKRYALKIKRYRAKGIVIMLWRVPNNPVSILKYMKRCRHHILVVLLLTMESFSPPHFKSQDQILRKFEGIEYRGTKCVLNSRIGAIANTQLEIFNMMK